MIGPKYWATGIHLDRHGRDDWSVSIKFLDDGFVNSRSTEGELRLRYSVKRDQLDEHIDLLIEDMQRLGIVWNEGTGATFYIPGDGESEKRTDNDVLIAEANRQCERLGWRSMYEPQKV